MSIDPLAEKYPYNGTYNFAENRVIDGNELEGLEWVNADGKKIYDPSLNDGKGAYTDYATRNDKRLGNSLQNTETGRAQFSKLVNSESPITTNLNESSNVTYSNKGGIQLGKTPTKATFAKDLSGNISVEGSKVLFSDITINVESIEYVMENIGDFDSEFGYLGELTFDEVLGVVFGHEIEHTTLENAIDASGGDLETKPTEVGKKIASEIKENKNEEKKD